MESKNIFVHPPKPAVIALVFFLAIFSLLGIVKIFSQAKQARFIGQKETQTHTLSVSGIGRISAKPDIALFKMNVSLEGYRLKGVQDQNTVVTNALVGFLKVEGVDAKDIQTSSYSIAPSWDYTNKGRKFRGFQIHNVLSVKVRDFEKIGTILEQAIGLGANDVSFRFDFEEREKLKTKAQAEAIFDAKQKAKILAGELGVNLVRIVSFSDQARGYALALKGEGAFEAEAAPGQPAIEAGESDIESTVTVVFEMN